MRNSNDIFWMQEAILQAKIAEANAEVPVGAVIVSAANEVIASGFNCPIKNNDPSAHAEIIVLRQAGQVLNNYRLLDTTLYVTLEPCPMCFGAMLQARIARLVFGARDPKTGVFGGKINLPQNSWNHSFDYSGGVLEDECKDLLQAFFKSRR